MRSALPGWSAQPHLHGRGSACHQAEAAGIRLHTWRCLVEGSLEGDHVPGSVSSTQLVLGMHASLQAVIAAPQACGLPCSDPAWAQSKTLLDSSISAPHTDAATGLFASRKAATSRASRRQRAACAAWHSAGPVLLRCLGLVQQCICELQGFGPHTAASLPIEQHLRQVLCWQAGSPWRLAGWQQTPEVQDAVLLHTGIAVYACQKCTALNALFCAGAQQDV